MTIEPEGLKEDILRQVRRYGERTLATAEFVPGQTYIPASGKVIDGGDLSLMTEAVMDGWLTEGRFAKAFADRLCVYLDSRHCHLCNSGSSANLLAVSALTSPLLKDKALKPGDEVLTPAAGFPSTLNPIIQNGLVPVFADIDPGTGNADAGALAAAVSPRTRAIVLAHTLGNPFDADAVVKLAQARNLWLIEDNCDALGSTYKGKRTGAFGDASTLSFYPAHQITTGEGGAVCTGNAVLSKAIASLRDWGRDCWCATGKDNTCGKRFEWQLGTLPKGYDHKYTYSHIGYNLKMTDIQAALGLGQMGKLEVFVAIRRQNWQTLHDALVKYEPLVRIMRPTAGSEPSWFGFFMTIAPGAAFTRGQIIDHLESKGIGTRLLFGGNLTRQPAYDGLKFHRSRLPHTDAVMERGFWVGVHPGIDAPRLNYMVKTLTKFLGS